MQTEFWVGNSFNSKFTVLFMENVFKMLQIRWKNFFDRIHKSSKNQPKVLIVIGITIHKWRNTALCCTNRSSSHFLSWLYNSFNNPPPFFLLEIHVFRPQFWKSRILITRTKLFKLKAQTCKIEEVM